MKISKMALIALASLALSTAAFAETQFTGNLVAPAGAFARTGTAPVVIHIDHYSSDAEVQRLAGILQQKGPNALRDALWDQEVGYIRVGGGLGYPIAAARSRPGDNGGRIVRLMIDRPISQREVINNTRTVDYPFGYIEIRLDASGKGDGQFYQAARVSMTGDTLKVENYSPQPLKLLAVKAR
jgi:hypothetical protein